MTTEGDDLLRLDQQVCFPLYAATNLLQRLYRPLLAPLELTYSQYLVMLVLWEREPAGANVTVGDLGHCLHLDNGTLTPLLKRMEQAGHITRKRDPKDERRVLVTLTAAGTALHERARAVPVRLTRQLEIDPEGMTGLRASAQDLVRVLSEKARCA